MGMDRHFSLKAFLKGVVIAIVAWASIAAWLIFRAQTHVSQDQTTPLASQVVEIEALPGDMQPPPPANGVEQVTVQEPEIHHPPAATPASGHLPAPDHPVEEPAQAVPPETSAPPPSPAPDIVEQSAHGPVPRIAPNGVTPFETYKKPFTKDDKPFLALAIRGYGLSAKSSEAMLESMPAEVTFILSPYAANAQEWADKAAQKGHEIWLDLPAETSGFPYDDPGPFGLLARNSIEENARRFLQILASAKNYAGLAGDTSGAYAPETPAFKTLLSQIMARGLAFVSCTPNARTAEIAEAAPGMLARASKIINAATPSLMEVDLLQRKQLVALADADSAGIKAATDWASYARAKGIRLAPLSAVMNPPPKIALPSMDAQKPAGTATPQPASAPHPAPVEGHH